MVEKSAEDLFEQLALSEPARDTDDFGDNDGDYDRPLDDYEKNNANLTDLQYLIKTLSPDFKDEVYNCLLVGRLSPDNFRPLFRLLVNNEVRRQRGNKMNVDVIKTAAKIYTILTIMLDGKHVVDLLEAFGSRASSTDIDELSKGLG